MIVLGLTGSIGMGKTTTARLFAEAGAAVFDSDQAVHDLYQGAAVAPIAARFPDVVINGQVNRKALARTVLADPDALRDLEAIVHPLVMDAQQEFLRKTRQAGKSIAILDIPLLFETGGDKRVDKTVVASAPADVQRARVLARPNMSVDKFEKLLARQMSDADKRARADYIIDTHLGLDPARAQVARIIKDLTGNFQAQR